MAKVAVYIGSKRALAGVTPPCAQIIITLMKLARRLWWLPIRGVEED